MFKPRWLTILALTSTLTTTLRADPYAEAPGPHPVTILKDTWQDPARHREIPVLICYPKDLSSLQPVPVIVFSHGLGASRETYADYGTHWASYGYVVIFPQHHGSDSALVGTGKMMDMMLLGKGGLPAFIDRVNDIHFLIDQITALNNGTFPGDDYTPFKNHLDPQKIGMSGHSFGAITTQAVTGEFAPADAPKLVDPRIKAAIAMSPSPAKGGLITAPLNQAALPTLFLTGTDDNLMSKSAADRRSAFDHATFPDTYLITFQGATHMTFTPKGTLGNKPTFQKFIRESTTAFWDAFLKNDPHAKSWLEKTLPSEMGQTGILEKKD